MLWVQWWRGHSVSLFDASKRTRLSSAALSAVDEANVTIAVGSVFVLLIWLWTLVLVVSEDRLSSIRAHRTPPSAQGLELGELRKSAFQHSRAYTWLSLVIALLAVSTAPSLTPWPRQGTLVALLVFFALGVWVFATRLIGSTNIKGTLWFIYLVSPRYPHPLRNRS